MNTEVQLRSEIVGIDVDEVLGELHAPWVAWGNREFGTNHTEFTHWDAPTDFWGRDAYRFLRPSIYDADTVKPIVGAVDAVNVLRLAGFDIRFVTSCGRNNHKMEQAKFSWLYRHGFLMKEHEFIPGEDKSKAAVDFLADDGLHNVTAFENHAILVTRSHNKLDPWSPRIDSIRDLPKYVFGALL